MSHRVEEPPIIGHKSGVGKCGNSAPGGVLEHSLSRKGAETRDEIGIGQIKMLSCGGASKDVEQAAEGGFPVITIVG